MIPKCDGCKYEWEQVCEMVRGGFHLATTIDDYSDNIGKKGHFFSMIVNDKGDVIWM